MRNSTNGQNNLSESKKLALHYMETLADVMRESCLILDSDIRVISANQLFYKTFKVTSKETENKFIYELGNKQWDILELRNLLEKILPDKKCVKNYEVSHIFEEIGEKTMMLNAKQIDNIKLIILAIEDITDRKRLEKECAEYTKDLEVKVNERTKELNDRIKELETLNKSMVGRELKMIELKEEIEHLKKISKN